MNLQPLYDVKSRLEQAAIAGTGLLDEDFRLRRSAEGLKPLAAASPVFGKIDAGLSQLLSAPARERGGLLLDLLALVDAVAYTQGSAGIQGELEPLPPRKGVCLPLSYGQLHPLLEALTGTGGGRMSQIQSTWEDHPEFFRDCRVHPALVAGLGESYAELAELNMKILKAQGPEVVPLLREGFDPAGKKEMARRVEVISALEGAQASPWLLEVLPEAKKEVRPAVIEALGADPANTALLLDLSKTERGTNREAVLKALAMLDGDELAGFWAGELDRHSDSVLFLRKTNTQWAAELVAAGLRERLEKMQTHGGRVPAEEQTELSNWCQAVGEKDFPVLLDFWRWADGHMETFDGFTNEKGNPVFAGVRLTDTLCSCMRAAGPGPLRDYCLELFDRRPAMTRYLFLSFQAALLSRPAAEVYEKYSPYLQKSDGDAEYRKTLRTVLLRALGEVSWSQQTGCYLLNGWQRLAEPLDRRWYDLLIRLPETEKLLRRLLRPDIPEIRDQVAAYLFNVVRMGGAFLLDDIRFLRQCGWTDWKGFLDRKVKKDNSMTTWSVIQCLNETSLTDLEKAAELRSLARIVQEQCAVSKRPKWPALAVQNQIAAWEAELNGYERGPVL